MKKEAWGNKSVDAEYLTRKIICLILQFLLKPFYCLIYATSETLNMLYSDKRFFPATTKYIPTIYKYWYCIKWVI